MKFLYLILFFLLSVQVVLANQVVTGGFGTDGATGESVPSIDSIEVAKKVFNSLKLEVLDGRKKITTPAGEDFECSRVGTESLGSINWGCSFSLLGSYDAKVVTVGPSMSAKLIRYLPSISKSESKSENIYCKMSTGFIPVCKISNVNAVEFDINVE